MSPSRLWIALAIAGCPAPQHPRPIATALTLEIGRDGASLRGVAGDGEMTFVAMAGGRDNDAGPRTGDAPSGTVIEARRGSTVVWRTPIGGGGGLLARTKDIVVA